MTPRSGRSAEIICGPLLLCLPIPRRAFDVRTPIQTRHRKDAFGWLLRQGHHRGTSSAIAATVCAVCSLMRERPNETRLLQSTAVPLTGRDARSAMKPRRLMYTRRSNNTHHNCSRIDQNNAAWRGASSGLSARTPAIAGGLVHTYCSRTNESK